MSSGGLVLPNGDPWWREWNEVGRRSPNVSGLEGFETSEIIATRVSERNRGYYRSHVGC